MRILGALLLATISVGSLIAAEPDSLFAAGNAAYRDGDYQGAVEYYEAILLSGVESGALYYNLGTAQFKAGDLGRSVAQFYRALRDLPRDDDIRSNLAFAEARTVDRSLVRSELPPLQLLASVSDRLTLREWFVALEGIYLAFLALLAIFLYRPAWRQPVRDPLLFTTGLLLLVLLFAAHAHLERNGARRAVVLASEAYIYSGPGEQFTREFVLHEGTVIRIHRNSEDWVLCSVTEELKGWIPSQSIDRL